jgi:Protein kinase domain
MIFGTPEYMSPEQAQGSPPDHRVDVYAVGCIMYHMLTGSVPFTAENFMGILTKHLLEAPVPPRKRRPDLEIPGEIEAICLRAMEKDRDKRYPDMDAFYRALGAAGDIAFEPSQVFVAPRLPKASLKYPTLAASNPEARESRTAIAAAGTGSFDDERPVRADGAAAGGRTPLVIAAIAAAVVVAIVVGVFALRPAGPATPAGTSTSAATAAPVEPAAPPAVVPAAVGAPAAPPAEPAKAAEAAPAAGSDTAKPPQAAGSDTPAPSKPGRSRRHRNESEDEPKADPLHRAIPVPTDPTPPELKGFPGSN